ncbi:hypothetical protein V1478_002398 [Vespula squamosa]|uniref:Uncharacterized protein n=1 Tax=Vespula squamosa TaxID=30214 RepID=A0ABD2BS99_VESSQ
MVLLNVIQAKQNVLYANRFLDRRLLNKKTFQRLHERLQDAGSFKKRYPKNNNNDKCWIFHDVKSFTKISLSVPYSTHTNTSKK